jgi:hypothetical protein
MDKPAVAEQVESPTGPAARRYLPRLLASGWLPALLVAGFTAASLRFFGVGLHTTALFTGYLVLGVTLPGTLVWRALNRGGGWFVADLAVGTVLGYAGEVATYLPSRLIGVPLLVLAWPVGTVAIFLAVPGLRRYWRSDPDRDRPPIWWNWSVASIAALLVFWSYKFFREYGLTWPFNSAPDTDSTFHLALIGEAKNHMPMSIPWVSGEPLYYHWFVYPEMAATSWVTGIEPQVLLLRLSLLPMIIAFAVLIAVLARKLFGNWWTGPVAAVVTFFVLAPDPYLWPLGGFDTNLGFNTVDDGGLLRLTLWTSPTQTFGEMLFVPVMIVLVDLLRDKGRDWRRWVLFVLLTGAVMGGKATYLPLLLAGLLVVIAGNLVARRRWHRGALVACAIVLGYLAFAQLVLFGGANQGLTFEPLQTMVTSGAGVTTGYTLIPQHWRLLVLTLIAVFSWAAIWFGISGLIRRRRLFDTEMLLLLGIGIAGVGGTLVFGQLGDSQMYFIQAARPYLALAAVGGLAAVLPARRLTGREVFALIVAAAVGAQVVVDVRRLGDIQRPLVSDTESAGRVTYELLWPYGLLLLAAVVAAVAVLSTRRRVPWLRGIGHGLIIMLLAGFGLSTAVGNYYLMIHDSETDGWRKVINGQQLVSKGTLQAGRWLRDNSSPNDLVATNAHCLMLAPGQPCSNLHFSMSAYSERRMLVEGWGFTNKSLQLATEQGIWYGWVKYWKPDVLADNDAAFANPSTQTIDRLRDRYGVRWLFVDTSQGGVSPDLGKYATLRFSWGDCAVYQIPGPGSGQ